VAGGRWHPAVDGDRLICNTAVALGQGSRYPRSVIRPVDVLLEFLHAQQARGMSHVHLDPDARTGLRALSERLRGGPPNAPAPRAAPAPAPAPRPAPAPPPGRARAVPLDALASAAEVAAPRPPVAVPRLVIEGSTAADQLASLRRQAEAWAPAQALGSLREVMVFATGNPAARIMFIGEAPGYEEEKKREPFVGPAGQKLDQILKAMGLARTDVYLSNIVKFRPATARQTTNSRPPTPAEIAACLPLVREEIRIIRPQCIVALGGCAADGLLGAGGDVPSRRGLWHDLDGVPVRVTYHPSHLLRSSDDNQTKRLVWEDMLAVMEQTGLPISAKQRGFFLPET
jgi:uracil-DNA glycosylase family 4